MLTRQSETILENVCVLIDDEGQETELFCAEFPVISSEFYKASQQGIMCEKALLINSDEYDYEETCVYEDVQYKIFRTFNRVDGYTELYLNQNVGV